MKKLDVYRYLEVTPWLREQILRIYTNGIVENIDKRYKIFIKIRVKS